MTSSLRVEAVLPLILAQRGIVAESAQHKSRYVGQQVLEITGPLDVERLATAWGEVVAVNQALRTRLVWNNADPKLLVTANVKANPAIFDLSDLPSDEAESAALRLIDQQKQAGFDLLAGPLVGIAVIALARNHHYLSIVHHHIAIDGRGMSALLRELALTYEARQDGAPRPGLVDVTRAIVIEEMLVPTAAVPELGVELNTFPANTGSSLQRSTSQTFDAGVVRAAARSAFVTPAAICLAAWANTIAALRGDNVVICLARDRRPQSLSRANSVIGMFTETVLLGGPFSACSLNDGAKVVLDWLHGEPRPPSLTEGLRRARQAGATGRPDVLLTVDSDGPPQAPESLSWRLISATEDTEFALDITIRLGPIGDLAVTYDVNRVTDQQVAELLDQTVLMLERPAQHHHLAPVQPSTRVTPPPYAFAATADGLSKIATSVAGRYISASDDLVATGWDSLALLELASALCAEGYQTKVSTLIELGSLDRVAASQMTTHEAELPPQRTRSSSLDPSSLESGFLRLSLNPRHPPNFLHEQSTLTFHERLDAGTLSEAFTHILATYPSLDRWWSTAPSQLTARGDRPAAFSSERVSSLTEITKRLEQYRLKDLSVPFRPGSGPLIRLHLITTETNLSAVVLSFHYAILDGWSFGTLIRELQAAYASSSEPPPPLGIDSVGYRSAPTNPSHQNPWKAFLSEVSPYTPPSRIGENRSSTAEAAISLHLVNMCAERLSTTAATALQAVVINALRSTGRLAATEACAVRMSVRDGSAVAHTRTLGQLTPDVPIPPAETIEETAALIVQANRMALDTKRVGSHDFAEAVGGYRDLSVASTAVVVENYLRIDEAFVRNSDSDTWQEAATARRDVSPSLRTVSLDPQDGGWRVGVQSRIDSDVQQITSYLALQATRILRAAVS